jgi:hypothetical protein
MAGYAGYCQGTPRMQQVNRSAIRVVSSVRVSILNAGSNVWSNESPMRRYFFHAAFNSDVHAGQRVALSGTMDRQ